MTRLLKFLTIAFCLIAGFDVLAEQKAPTFKQEHLDALKEGEVVFLEPEGRNMLAAVIRIDADPKLVWELMLDHERIPKYVKELRESKILESGENWKIVEHKLKMHPLLPRFVYVFKETYGPGYTVEFNRIRGAFRELEGSWNLVSKEKDTHALLLYTTYVDFGWYIPKSWIRKGINKRVPALLNAFREEVYREVQSRAEEKEEP